EGAIVVVECLLRTTELAKPVTKQRHPAHDRCYVTVFFGDLHRAAEFDNARRDVALKECDETQFAISSIRPRGVAERGGDFGRFTRGLFRETGVEISVRFAFDDQSTKVKAGIGLD